LNSTQIKINMSSHFLLIHNIVNWCNEFFGPATKFADGLSAERLWYFQHDVTCWTFYFFRESDAVLFALKWGNSE
jgi:hypothetical protein